MKTLREIRKTSYNLYLPKKKLVFRFFSAMAFLSKAVLRLKESVLPANCVLKC